MQYGRGYSNFSHLKWSVDNSYFVEVHSDVLDPGVEGDGQHVQRGVGAGDLQPQLLALATTRTETRRRAQGAQEKKYIHKH